MSAHFKPFEVHLPERGVKRCGRFWCRKCGEFSLGYEEKWGFPKRYALVKKMFRHEKLCGGSKTSHVEVDGDQGIFLKQLVAQ